MHVLIAGTGSKTLNTNQKICVQTFIPSPDFTSNLFFVRNTDSFDSRMVKVFPFWPHTKLCPVFYTLIPKNVKISICLFRNSFHVNALFIFSYRQSLFLMPVHSKHCSNFPIMSSAMIAVLYTDNFKAANV